MFGRRKTEAEDAADANTKYQASMDEMEAALTGWANDARDGAPRTYPDGSPFALEPHLTDIVALGMAAAREGDIPVVATCMELLVAHTAAATTGPTMEYAQNILDARQYLLSRGAEEQELTLSSAALNLSSYWEATGQLDSFIRENVGKPAE
jgi:hypothetical protein